MNNLQDDGWDLTDLKYIDLPAHEADLYRLNPGDILFNRTNSKELVGKCEVFRESGHWVFASYLIRVTLDESKALPEFVSRFLNTKAGRAQIDRVSRQIVGMSNINAEEIRELLIPLPSIEIQRSLIAELEAAREARQKKLTQADDLLTSLDDFLLSQLNITLPPENTQYIFAVKLYKCKSGRIDAPYYSPHFIQLAEALAACPYIKVALGDIANPVGGATPTKGDKELYAEEGIKFLRIMNVTPYEINLSDIKYIQDSVHTGELSRSQLAADDVLMTITGRVGTTAIVPKDILPANINQHIVRLRIQRQDCLPIYLAAYLNSSIGLGLSNREVTGGTRIALDYDAVRNLQIPLPPLTIQQAITNEVNRRRKEASRLREEAAKEWSEAKARFERKLLGEEA